MAQGNHKALHEDEHEQVQELVQGRSLLNFAVEHLMHMLKLLGYRATVKGSLVFTFEREDRKGTFTSSFDTQ